MPADAAPEGEGRPTGRPSTFTEEVATAICERLAKGEPLAVICRDEDMPHRSTVYDWQSANADLSRRIGRAREAGFDAIAYRARETARGKDESQGGDSSGDVQRDKLIIETDLKLLAKWDPKRYGDKLALTGGGADDAPIRTVRRIERVIIDPSARNA